eukprot:XP_011668181.1 PREDICTED: uncharacterized protein LOC105440109 [Strongylocentrotus purpuratus]
MSSPTARLDICTRKIDLPRKPSSMVKAKTKSSRDKCMRDVHLLTHMEDQEEQEEQEECSLYLDNQDISDLKSMMGISWRKLGKLKKDLMNLKECPRKVPGLDPQEPLQLLLQALDLQPVLEPQDLLAYQYQELQDPLDRLESLNQQKPLQILVPLDLQVSLELQDSLEPQDLKLHVLAYQELQDPSDQLDLLENKECPRKVPGLDRQEPQQLLLPLDLQVSLEPQDLLAYQYQELQDPLDRLESLNQQKPLQILVPLDLQVSQELQDSLEPQDLHVLAYQELQDPSDQMDLVNLNLCNLKHSGPCSITQ